MVGERFWSRIDIGKLTRPFVLAVCWLHILVSTLNTAKADASTPT